MKTSTAVSYKSYLIRELENVWVLWFYICSLWIRKRNHR